MSGRLLASNKVAIVGYGQSMVERHSDETLGALAVKTARACIADAGLSPEEIDGYVSSSLFPSAGAHAAIDGVSLVTANWLAEHMGGHATYVSGFQGFGQIPGIVSMAVNAISSGAADYVLVQRALHSPKASYHGNAMTEISGNQQWTAPQGFFGPLTMIALSYNEYLQRYGATREAMAAVLVEARKNGARIPWSYWYDKPLSAEEYLDSPLIVDPICRYDCDIPVDGVASFLFTSSERAQDLPHSPVYVSGFAMSAPSKWRLALHWPLDDIMEVGGDLAARLYASAAIGPNDVDLPQVYDGFSPFVYYWLESLGFAERGGAHQLALDGGLDSDVAGALPALSGGGALGNGRMHGIPQMLECYLQLSGRAGARQRSQAAIGISCHSSPHLGGAVAYSATPY